MKKKYCFLFFSLKILLIFYPPCSLHLDSSHRTIRLENCRFRRGRTLAPKEGLDRIRGFDPYVKTASDFPNPARLLFSGRGNTDLVGNRRTSIRLSQCIVDPHES